MKRLIKASSVEELNDFDYDEEEDYFDIFYDADSDKYVAQGDLEKFESDSLKDLADEIKKWNRDVHNREPYVGVDIEDNIDYELDGVKDEDEYYGEYIIHQYIETIY